MKAIELWCTFYRYSPSEKPVIRLLKQRGIFIHCSYFDQKSMSSPEQQVTPKVHLLPCNIAFNGPAPISNYFQIEVSHDGSQYTSHFRGRKLVGKKIDFTESKAAMATAVTHPHMEDSASKSLEIQHSVDSFVLWGHDHPSSVNFTEMYDDLLEISTGVSLH